MLTVLYTKPGQDSRRALLERMRDSGAGRCVLLVPDNYSHECERLLCAVAGNGAGSRCEVLSFSRLASRMSDLLGGGAAPVLDGGGRILLMYAALRRVGDCLKVYRAPSRKPAFLTGLMATVDECRSYQVPPRSLIDIGERVGGQQGDKWRDIGLIYQAYEDLCAHSAADPRSRLVRLPQQLRDTGWGAGAQICIHGFAGFSPQEEGVIEVLARQGEVTLALTCGQDEEEGGVFDFTRRAAGRLIRRLPPAQVRRETLRGYEKEEPSLAFLDRHLLGELPTPWQGPCAVRRVRCGDPRQEVEWAAAEILRLARQEGLRFRDVAVGARRMGVYGELVESTFARYGIPVFRSARVDILQKPVVALATSALAAAAEHYPYEQMFRYLKTGLTGITAEERDLLENYVLTWNIRGAMWTRERPWDMHPEGYGQTFTDEQRSLVARLDGLRRRVIAPLEELRLSPDRSGPGRAAALYRFLEDIRLPELLEERAEQLEERGDLNTAAQYRQLWEILAGALEQCALLLEQTELELEEFSRLFSLALSQYDVSTIPVSLDRVTVGDVTRMTHKEVKVLFLLGADSTAIPDCTPSPGLFSDQDRDALGREQVELAPRQDCLLRRELAIAWEACAIPREKLYLSYAAAPAGSEERTPCLLWERMGLLFPEQPPVLAEDAASRMAAPGPALELAGRSPALAKAMATLPGYSQRVERLGEAARWRRGSLSPAAVETLFGRTVGMSATRLDQLNSCHFKHFMRYGMEAKPRQQAKFRPTEYGTFVHAVLEGVLKQAGDHGGVSALAADPVLRRSLALNAANRYQEETLAGLEGESARFRWLFERMKQGALAVTDSVVAELAECDFIPVEFELGFGPGRELPAVEVRGGVTLRLSGFVDRVDEWRHDGKRYLRVVDYKTGKKSFDFSEIEDGRGLQMLLYLFALSRAGDGETVPAGVLYVPARNHVVDGERSMTEEQIAAGRDKALRRRGLVLDEGAVIDAMERPGPGGEYRFLPIGGGRNGRDYLVSGEQMALLDEYITDALKDAAAHVAGGDISADPYWHDGSNNACRWCDYREACHFEPCCGDSRRWRRGIGAGEFWQWMLRRKEDGQDGN